MLNYWLEKMIEFAKEMYVAEEIFGNKSTRDKLLIRWLNSPDITASGIVTIFLPENPNELCDSLQLLLQEKQDRNKSGIIDEEIVAMADKL